VLVAPIPGRQTIRKQLQGSHPKGASKASSGLISAIRESLNQLPLEEPICTPPSYSPIEADPPTSLTKSRRPNFAKSRKEPRIICRVSFYRLPLSPNQPSRSGGSWERNRLQSIELNCYDDWLCAYGLSPGLDHIALDMEPSHAGRLRMLLVAVLEG